MALYKVKKTPLKDNTKKEPLKVGDIIERTVKDVKAFENKFGKEYLERVDDKEEKEDEEAKASTSKK